MSCPDPFEFLAPSIVVDERDRRQLEAGEAIVRMLPGEGGEIAVFGAVPVEFDGDRLVAWVRQIEDLKQSEHVPAVSRFSEPTAPSDLAAHELTDEDLEKLRACRPDDCDIKLTAEEISRVRERLSGSEDWKAAAQQVFRQIVLDRIVAYRARGLAGLDTYADGHIDEPIATIFERLVRRSPYLVERTPRLVSFLTEPGAELPGGETFLYWSTDQFGGRPVTSAVHVVIQRFREEGLPDALVAGKQLFATHYQNGALSLTLLLRGCSGPPNYLVYVNRSSVDVIRGMFGWLVRRIVQGRVQDEAAEVLEDLRERMSRPPPGR